MKIAGEATLHAPVEEVWDALLDPSVLVRTIPGCERLQATGENSYAMTVTVGLAAIKGTYSGSCSLTDLRPHESLKLSAQGAGVPGTIAADAQVRFTDNGDGTTTLSYDSDTVVGGMIGGVGQRMLSSVSKRLAGEFFGAVDRALSSEAPALAPAPAAAAPAASGAGAAAPPESPPPVFTAPGQAAAPPHQGFLTGVAVGAGLVALGVVLGAVAGRRR